MVAPPKKTYLFGPPALKNKRFVYTYQIKITYKNKTEQSLEHLNINIYLTSLKTHKINKLT